jgi:hypothetical protein
MICLYVGVTSLTYWAGFPAHNWLLLIVTLSKITAPPATTLPFYKVACLTVDPIPTNALFPILAPWITEFGPTKT